MPAVWRVTAATKDNGRWFAERHVCVVLRPMLEFLLNPHSVNPIQDNRFNSNKIANKHHYFNFNKRFADNKNHLNGNFL